MSKERKFDILADIAKDAEMVENLNTTAGTDNENSVLARKLVKAEPRKGFTISFSIDEYNKFINYLNDNDIRYGSQLIRNLLKEKNIL